MLLGIYTALASGTATSIPVNTPRSIDFSFLDTMVGGVVVLAVLIVVGAYLLSKGWIKFGSFGNLETEGCPNKQNYRSEMRMEIDNILSSIKEAINELRDDIKTYAREHQECQRQLPEKYVQWEIFNRIMDKLEGDRRDRWKKFDEHSHSSDGNVKTLRQA